MKTAKLKPTTLAAIAGAVLAAAVLLVWTSGPSRADDDDKKPAVRPALTVTTVLPQRVSMPVKLAANGNIVAWQEAIVGAEASGLRIAQVHVNVGDRVKKGQVLATFAEGTPQAELAQMRANLAEAEAAAADAAGNAQRARSLESTGALSASQINQYLTAEKTARAKAEAARAMLQAQQVRVSQTQVRAPDAGIISARNATVGAVVGNGAELFRLIRQGRLEWRAEVTSQELGRITTGTTALVTAASGARLTGRVRTIGPTVDPQTRAALVYVDVTPLPGAPASALSAAGPPRGAKAPSGGSAVHAVPSVGAALPGMFARGEFDLGATPALTVPQAAVVVRDGFSYVYRLNADGRVSQVKVQTGRLAGDQLEIVGGLAADARVVAAGAGFLNDGDMVRVTNGQALGAGRAASAPASPASR